MVFANTYLIDLVVSIVAIMCLHEFYKAFRCKAKPIEWVGYILMYDRLHLVCREIHTRIDTFCWVAGKNHQQDGEKCHKAFHNHFSKSNSNIGNFRSYLNQTYALEQNEKDLNKHETYMNRSEIIKNKTESISAIKHRNLQA